VLYITELLQDVMEYRRPGTRRSAARSAVRGSATIWLTRSAAISRGLDPEALTQVLIAGLTPAELRVGRGVVFALLDPHDFVIDPPAQPDVQPGFECLDRGPCRGHQHGRAGPAPRVRAHQVIYRHHPGSRAPKCLYGPQHEQVEGGDVLLLARGRDGRG